MSPSGSSASDLLHRFATSRCGEAFRELVKRYSGFVMAVARRQTAGDVQAAEDIVQEVFTGLAREVKKVRGETLGAWLHRRTVFAAGHWRRGEQRRRTRETAAAEMQEAGDAPRTPVPEGFDEAFARLRETDQQVLLWRYVEEWDYRTIGVRTGLSEDAAQKRSARALEQLRTALVKRGALHSTSALAAVMVAAAGRGTASAAQQAKWVAAAQHAGSLSWLAAGLALPAACLAAGVALPVLTMRQDFAARSTPVQAAAGESAAVSAATAQAKRQDAVPPSPGDYNGLFAMMEKAETSALWKARLDRAVGGLSAAACRKMIEDQGYKPDYSGLSNPRLLIELRKRLVAQWSEKDPADAVGRLRDSQELSVAFRALGAKDIAAAERAVMAAVAPESTDRASHQSSSWRAALRGLASKDLDAALALLNRGRELGLPYMDSLYGEICEEVSRTNPVAGARMMAQRGSEEDNYYRAQALGNVAKSDARLAWSMLQAVPVRADQREQLESQIFTAMLEQDGSGAVQLAGEMLGKWASNRAREAAEVLFRSGYGKALEEAARCPAGEFREALLLGLHDKLTTQNPKEALTKFRADDPATSALWWKALSSLASTDTEAAAAVKVPDGARSDEVVPGLAAALANKDLESAGRWAESLPESCRKKALEAIAGVRQGITTDPAAAAREAVGRSDPAIQAVELNGSVARWYARDPAAAMAFSESLSGQQRMSAQAGIVSYTRVRSPSQVEAAQRMIAEWGTAAAPLPKMALDAAQRFADECGRENGEAASGWVDTLPRGPLFDQAACGLAMGVAQTDPHDALVWAAAIGDERVRESAAYSVLVNWSRADADDARAAVEALDAPAATKAAFFKLLRPRP